MPHEAHQQNRIHQHLASKYHNITFIFYHEMSAKQFYTLSLQDALPISPEKPYNWRLLLFLRLACTRKVAIMINYRFVDRSEEHTSELQSLTNLVCRLLLEKKKRRKKQLTALHVKLSKYNDADEA